MRGSSSHCSVAGLCRPFCENVTRAMLPLRMRTAAVALLAAGVSSAPRKCVMFGLWPDHQHILLLGALRQQLLKLRIGACR